MTTGDGEISPGTIWICGAPKWIQYSKLAWLAMTGGLLKGLNRNGILFDAVSPVLSDLPAFLFLLIACLVVMLGPPVLLSRLERGPLRSIFPDLAALRWDNDGIEIPGHGFVPWETVDWISEPTGKRGDRLVIFSRNLGQTGRFQINARQMLPESNSVLQLRAAHRTRRDQAIRARIGDQIDMQERDHRAKLRESYGKTMSQIRAEQGVASMATAV